MYLSLSGLLEQWPSFLLDEATSKVIHGFRCLVDTGPTYPRQLALTLKRIDKILAPPLPAATKITTGHYSHQKICQGIQFPQTCHAQSSSGPSDILPCLLLLPLPNPQHLGPANRLPSPCSPRADRLRRYVPPSIIIMRFGQRIH